MRVFLDTNVLFSGLHARHGTPNRILEAATSREIQPVVSVEVLQELVRNIRRKAPRLIADLQVLLTGMALEVVPEPTPDNTRPWYAAGLGSDGPIIAAALGAQVDYLCTGDRRLLARGRAGTFGGLRVVSPPELAALLESADEDA